MASTLGIRLPGSSATAACARFRRLGIGRSGIASQPAPDLLGHRQSRVEELDVACGQLRPVYGLQLAQGRLEGGQGHDLGGRAVELALGRLQATGAQSVSALSDAMRAELVLPSWIAVRAISR